MFRVAPILVWLPVYAALAGCNDTRNLAPPSPSTPWQAHADTGDGSSRIAPASNAEVPWPGGTAAIDPGHAYSLTELIDIAQRRNQGTRIAWEQARQAAIGVGMTQAAYLPQLAAEVLGGYQHLALPQPIAMLDAANVSVDAREIVPQLTIRYLLLDFGARSAKTEVAWQTSLAANVAFNGVHQRLIFEVAHAYFMFDGAKAELAAARDALANAQIVEESAQNLYDRGLGTIVDLELARRGTAQARFEIARATAGRHDALYGLLQVMDLPPTTPLCVEDSSARPLSRGAGQTVEALMHMALSQRPDLQAGLAKMRASLAGIAEARSAFGPTLSLAGNLQENIGQMALDDGPYASVGKPQGGVLLRLDWPLYEGGLRENRLHLAQAGYAEAQDSLRQQESLALRQVALAYDQVETGLRQYDAAIALQAAGQTAFDATRDAYLHGVGTLTDATAAQTALATARATVAKTHSQSLINAAALAFATGELTSSQRVSR